MSQRRKPSNTRVKTLFRVFISLVAIAVMLYAGKMAVKFCLGLFVDGFVVTLPGYESPIISESDIPKATAPKDGDHTVIVEVARTDMLATGDLMLHLPIIRSAKSGKTYDFSSIFQYLNRYINQADYAVVNLETTLSGTDGLEYTGYPKFNSPDAITTAVKNVGFDMMLTGNNHCYDYGTPGLKRTLQTIKDAGLAPLGTTESNDEPKFAVKDVGGIKIGMICYTYGEIGDKADRPSVNGLPTDSAAAGLINVFDYSKLDAFYSDMKSQIASMEAMGAETIVLFIHWGEEYTTKSNEKQAAIAQKMCDLGVDVIVGGHPHVVQPMELLSSTTDSDHKTICLYSTGNFLSNQRATNISLTTGHSEDSLLFTFTFVKYSDGTVVVESVDLLPTWVLIRGSGDNRKYQILPLDQTVADWKTTFDLSKGQMEDAQASFNRTSKIVKSGLDQVKAYLAQAKAERAGAGYLAPGVG